MINQTEIGTFIAKCRKEKKLTQAQLAEKLNITDRAVSKWETGKSMPDPSIMLELCELLGITVNELLSGAAIDVESCEKKADENLIDLKGKDEKHIPKNRMIAILFSAALFSGIMICLICNIAISGNVTWSLIPVSSIIFAWMISFPSIIWKKRGIIISLIALSIFILPYLFLLSSFLKAKDIFSIGAATAAVSIIYLWMTSVVFIRIGKARKFIALGITFLLAIPLVFIINLVLSKMTATPILDVWDIITVFILLILAAVSFLCDCSRKKE